MWLQANSVNDLIMARWRKIKDVRVNRWESHLWSDIRRWGQTHTWRQMELPRLFQTYYAVGNTKKDKWFGVGWNTSYSDSHAQFLCHFPPFDSSHESLELLPAVLLIEMVRSMHTTFKKIVLFFLFFLQSRRM